MIGPVLNAFIHRTSMQDNIKIIRDISLLYELSLAVGSSLDAEENCQHFVRTLLSRKGLNFASVWLKKSKEDKTEYCELFYAYPSFRVKEQVISCNHEVLKQLETQPYVSVGHEESLFQDIIHEKKVAKGSYAFFRMGGMGFLKLYALNREQGFPQMEMAQLKNVVDKFTISMEGCLAHAQYREELQQRTNMQQTLEQVNSRYSDLFDNMYDALIVLDKNGNVKESNKAARKLLGYGENEQPQVNIKEVVHPADAEKSGNYFRQLLEKGYYSDYEGRIFTKNGEVKHIHVNSNAIIENGNFAGSRDIVRDVTGQKEVERRVRESEATLRQVINNSLDAVVTINGDGMVTEWSQQAEQIFGLSREEVIGRLLSDLIIPHRYREAHQKGMERFHQSGEGPVLGKRIEITALRKNGEEFPIELSIAALKNDDGHFFSAFLRDITQQKKAQEAIRESEEKYRGMIENMELGLLEVDTNHVIVRPYQHFCNMIGYSPKELIGKNALDLFVSEEYLEIMKRHDSIREQGQSSIYEVQLRRKDGSKMWALISGAPIKDNAGKITGSIGVHYDLTARKQLETELAEAKHVAEHARLAERQFLANMSHEIRTPMNAVIGMTHLLYETKPTPLQKEYLDSLRFSADSLMGIIDNVLDLSKIEAGELEFEEKGFNLEQLLKSLQRTFQFKVREKAISVTMDFDHTIQNLVIGDPTRLNQVLTNLLGNASKFTEKGTIGVRAKLLNSTPESYTIEFRVHDTGIGIPRDKLNDIFQNFKQANVQITRKYGGTGLGLTIVKQIVEMQGGTIRAESTEEEGSNFIFTLPLKNSGILTTEVADNSDLIYTDTRQFLKTLNILVVEDNTMNQKLITKILDLWECRYDVAKNGLEAIVAADQKVFDLILMDIHMPEMDGCEAASLIRKEVKNPNRQTPIIALTAAALLEEKKRALESGMNDFLTKPFSPRMLEDCVLHLLGVKDYIVKKVKPVEHTDSDIVIRVDLQYLFEFSNGDRLFVRDMVETFLQEMPGAIEKLFQSLKEEDWDQVYKIVHKLKPNFMMLGMKAQQDKSVEVENMIKKGEINKDHISEIINWLATCAKLAFPVLEEKLEHL